MFGASISFPYLFLCSLNEVHRSSAVGHVLIHPIFIHKILLFLGLVDFPSDVPPLTTLDDSDIQRTLDHVLTVQAAQGQLLVDILDEIRGLRVDLARFQRSSSPPPFDDGFLLPFGIPSQKGGVHMRCF